VTLASWLEPLPDAEGMRATDRWAIEERGVPSLDLMERAGTGLARVVEKVAPDGRVAVVSGKGNNGGDGLVAARALRQAGREVDVLFVGDPQRLRGDAAENLRRLPGEGPVPFSPRGLGGCAVAVDALLGTGSSGGPRGEIGETVQAINDSGVPVVAADVPTGVDASTGEVPGVVISAAATATFHAAKPGLWISPGKDHAGEVRVIEIGIPAGAPVAPAVGLIAPEVRRQVPRRERGATKFSSGYVLVVGGSTGLTGAPCLASEAAMRAGAGYVTVGAPASLDTVLEARLLEVMTMALPDRDGALTESAAEAVLEETERRGGALVLGPGLGREEHSLALARDLAARAPVPLLLDADGLNAHAGHLGSLAGREAPTVLTPHAGELGRLLEIDSGEVARRRLHHAREAADRAQAILVLKGDDTLVAAPDGRVGVSRGGCSALATAGTGDVLSGVVAAILAKGLDPFTAVCAAVLIHAEAGRLAAVPAGPDGVIASDVIAALPQALGR